MNVAAEDGVLFPISYPAVIEALLPYLGSESQIFLCPRGKPAFDELQGPLQSQGWSEQKMEVVGHQDKFVQQIFLLRPVAKQDIHKQVGHPVGLENVLFLK